MKIFDKLFCRKRLNRKRGDILIPTLIFMLLGFLMIVPLLSFMGTGLTTGGVYDKKADTLYAADAGVEDAMWKIQYNHLETSIAGYNRYDYSGTGWTYLLPEQVNKQDVNVTIRNMWMAKDIAVPDLETANYIINDKSLSVAGGGVKTTNTFNIAITYNKETGDNLKVSKIGVWLPPGFSYQTGSSNLESLDPEFENTDFQGGTAVIWTFSQPDKDFTDLPGVNQVDDPMTANVSFTYTTSNDATPEAVSWIECSGLSGDSSDVIFCWDKDVRVFGVSSTTGGGETTVQTYIVRTEIRKNGEIKGQGDYYATGNSLMSNDIPDNGHIRESWINTEGFAINSSCTIIDSLSPTPNIEAAFLYWTAWQSPLVFSDLCGEQFFNWNRSASGSRWTIYNNSSYQGRGSTDTVDKKTLTMKTSLDLSSCIPGMVTISWNQTATGLESTDTFYYAFSGDDGATWSSNIEVFHDDSPTPVNPVLITIPDAYKTDGFKIRFYFNFNDTDDYIYIDNIKLNATFSDDCNNFNRWNLVGALSQTKVPTGDGDISGTWNTSPYWNNVDEIIPNDADYMTGTTDSGGYKYFNFSAFSVPTGSTITDLTVYVRAKDTGSNVNDIRPAIKVNGTRYNTISPATDPGTSFATTSFSFTTNPNTSAAWMIDDLNGSGSHPLQQFGVYSSDLNPDVQISMVYAQVNYSLWSIYDDDDDDNKFRGRGNSSANEDARTLTLSSGLKLSTYAPGSAKMTWSQTASGLESNDTFYYAFSADGGNTWGSNIEAFHDDSPAPTNPFLVTIPDTYLTDNFKIRFYFNFNDSSDYVYIDNIKVIEMEADTEISFKINDHIEEIAADQSSIIVNNTSGVNKGYSYACNRNVTNMIKDYSDGGVPGSSPEVWGNGSGTYSVGGVDGRKGFNGGDYQLAHAGWSLIIIYSDPTILSHQIILYDKFTFADDDVESNPTRGDLDFDASTDPNHIPGGDINGFTIPAQTRDAQGNWEVNAASITAFVGEGDEHISGDFIALNAPAQYWDTNFSSGTEPSDIPDTYKLWDGQSVAEDVSDNTSTSPDNVWNSHSDTCTADGIDVDTFYVPWDREYGPISPGQTSAHIDLYTNQDNWNLVYIIFSFRSETTTSGSLSYLIRG